jgi:hypothetical protein
MSYRNPAIIKDDSGLIIPAAIERAAGFIASGITKWGENQERIRKEAALKSARDVKANNKSIDEKNRIKSGEEKSTSTVKNNYLQTDMRTAKEELINEIAEAKMKRENTQDRAAIQHYQAEETALLEELRVTNQLIVKYGEGSQNATSNMEDGSVTLGSTTDYNAVGDDNGNTMKGVDAAYFQAPGTSIRYNRKTGTTFEWNIGGRDKNKFVPFDEREAAGEAYGSFNISNADLLSGKGNTTHSITQVATAQAARLSQKIFNDKGEIDSKYIDEGGGYTRTYDQLGDDGKANGTTVTQPIQKMKVKYSETINNQVAEELAELETLRNGRDYPNIMRNQYGFDDDTIKAFRSATMVSDPELYETINGALEQTIMNDSGMGDYKKGADGIWFKDLGKATVTKPSDGSGGGGRLNKSEKEAIYYRDIVAKEFKKLKSDSEYTAGAAMESILPTQVGNTYLGSKITDIVWGDDGVVITVNKKASDSSVMTAGTDGDISNSTFLNYGNVNDMMTLATSVGGGLKDPIAAKTLAVQITSKFKGQNN